MMIAVAEETTVKATGPKGNEWFGVAVSSSGNINLIDEKGEHQDINGSPELTEGLIAAMQTVLTRALELSNERKNQQ